MRPTSNDSQVSVESHGSTKVALLPTPEEEALEAIIAALATRIVQVLLRWEQGR